VAWSNPYLIVFVINGAGVILQFMALILFGLLLRQTSGEFQRVFTSTLRVFIYMALFCFVMKILMQTALVIPAMAKVGYTIRSFVIGFMHLILLGVTTMGIFGFAFYNGMLSPRARRGALLAMLGFLLVEVLLFVQGILLWAAIGFMPWYYEALVVASVMIAAGVLWMRYRQTSHVSVAV